MLYERDAYGTGDVPLTPEEEAKIEEETEMELLSELEPGPKGEPPTVALKIDRRAGTVTIYDRSTDEILFHTSIGDHDKLLRQREILRHLGKSGQRDD